MSSEFGERCPYVTLEDLSGAARRLNLRVPVAASTAALAAPVILGQRRIPNRFCVQPMEGADAGPDGAPGALTLRRYQRYAAGGFGLIWVEATAVNKVGRSNPRKLWLNPRSLPGFTRLVTEIKQTARRAWGHEAVVVVQLSCAGRLAAAPDTDLEQLQEDFAAAGRLAEEAGFDGVDIKACHGDLAAACLAARDRPGPYGGDFENRSRFLLGTVRRCRALLTRAFIAARLGADAEARPNEKGDPAEAVALARALAEAGVSLLNVSVAVAAADAAGTPRDPLATLARRIEVTRAIRDAVPSIPVIGGGYSWLRQWLPAVAAGVVNDGAATLIGVGRAALAYPDLAGDVIRAGRLDPDRCCLLCSACMQLLKDGGPSGCVIMDRAQYGEHYRRQRHFALDHLRDEARRCHNCQPAPCRQGCLTRIDIPAFVTAFARDDLETAYNVIRRTNVLPEMCAHLCLPNAMCEGPCVASTLEQRPIPIHDIQYAVCWTARQRGLTGVRLPPHDSGKQVAIVGGGPAGVACAVILLERGHQVDLFERTDRLGGTPEHLIRPNRFAGARAEMDAVLQPALRDGRLALRFNKALGRDLGLSELREQHAAVFLAPGVWGERSLERRDGVMDGLTFLQRTRSGALRALPPRVVLLAGGDSAVDSAMVAWELGVRDLTVVYEGTLAELNWHQPDTWFRTAGVTFMMRTRPLGYDVDAAGKVTGVRVFVSNGDASGAGTGMVLPADVVIESLGLKVEPAMAEALPPHWLTENGLIKQAKDRSFASDMPGVFVGGGAVNGGAAVVQCIAEGMQAGVEIDRYLGDADA